MHMVVMIVGEVHIERVEMVVVQIIEQCIVLVPEVRVHEEVLSSARDHGAVSPHTRVAVIDRRDLHIAAGGFRLDGRGKRCGGNKDPENESEENAPNARFGTPSVKKIDRKHKLPPSVPADGKLKREIW